MLFLSEESSIAEIYALDKSDFFTEKEDLKMKYALLWCLMSFTRPIDTLCLTVKDSTNEFSQRLLKIAEECGEIVVVFYSISIQSIAKKIGVK
jgi:ACT domain-containing protein